MTKLLIGLCTILVVLDASSGCTYWCRKPMSFEYTCCDVVNPSLLNPTTVSGLQWTTPAVTTSPTEVSDQPQRKSCRYYCVYGDDVYCCDDGSSPLPENHNAHDGRCPLKKEQVCKKGGIFLHVHASKLTTKTGQKMISKKTSREEHPDCASDGYCLEDEKCCENICAKKHTCLKAVYDYEGGTEDVQQKKKKSKY